MAEDNQNVVEIFSDGACLGNPGPGGWAALLRYSGQEKEIAGGDPARLPRHTDYMREGVGS